MEPVREDEALPATEAPTVASSPAVHDFLVLHDDEEQWHHLDALMDALDQSDV
jgi:hypothetical protein